MSPSAPVRLGYNHAETLVREVGLLSLRSAVETGYRGSYEFGAEREIHARGSPPLPHSMDCVAATVRDDGQHLSYSSIPHRTDEAGRQGQGSGEPEAGSGRAGGRDREQH